jgi:DNA-binding IclR family transcriptional regulator
MSGKEASAGTVETGPSRYSVPALEKGLEVLELLATMPAGLNVTALAGKLGRSTGELYRIVQYLEYRGYIDRNRENDVYSLSFRLFQLSHEHPPIRSLTVCAVPVMDRLAIDIGQSCHLAVLNRTNAVIVAQVDSPLPIRYSVRLGASFPVWETSSGLMLSAFLKPSPQSALIAQVARLTTAAELSEFERQLIEVREQGYEQRESLMIGGITNLSRPVTNHIGDLIAVLTVPFLAQRGNAVAMESASAQLAEAAETVSRALGTSRTDRTNE